MFVPLHVIVDVKIRNSWNNIAHLQNPIYLILAICSFQNGKYQVLYQVFLLVVCYAFNDLP